MKTTHTLFLAGLCAAGTLAGYGFRTLSAGDPTAVSSSKPALATSGQTRETGGGTTVEERSGGKAIPRHESTDTVESLLASDPALSYGRAAAWLAGVGEQEIAAFWAGYQGGKRTNDMTDLIFLNWTRVNPRGAAAALAGSKDEHYVWWAWAAHDPKVALAEAIANNPDRVNNVTWGIGEFHPEWMRENFDKLPENARGNAMAGMQKWTDGQDPEGSLDFMREHQMGFDKNTFLSLVRKDPWAAEDWLKRNPWLEDRYSGEDSVVNVMVTTLARERPEDLERMMTAAPAGEMKRKMEQVMFEQLVAEDPEKALEQARKGEVPMQQVQQLASVGLRLLQKEPERAFALAAELLETGGGKLGYETRLEYGNGGSSWGENSAKAHQLVDALFAKDPARTLDLMRGDGTDKQLGIFSNLVERWGEEDLTGLSEWANRQSDPEVRDAGALRVALQLGQQGEYEEALEWAGSLGTESREAMISNIASQWGRRDPEAMTAWLENSDLPEERKKRILEQHERRNERNHR